MTYAAGDVLDFDNGGRIRIQFIENGWVFYAKWHPGLLDRDPLLERKPIGDFETSVQFTRDKIASPLRLVATDGGEVLL